MKKIVIGVLVLILAVILALAALFLPKNLDSIVKGTIEDVGTELTGTNVSLEGTTIDLTKGSATPQEPPTGEPAEIRLALNRFVFANTKAQLITETQGNKTI